jgi:phosphatidylglycerol:prolipoprotein diacylglycerol transferase
MGFLVGYWVLLFLARKKLYVVKPDKVSDVITFTAFFGVFLGGRIGYVFFYMIPEKGWGHVLNDPLTIIRVWDGGMASHGGILGIMLFTLIYAWRNKVSWVGLGDGICIVAPLGILFGRVANFINGELYGIYTKAGAWYGVKFPGELNEYAKLATPGGWDAREAALNEALMVNDKMASVMAAVDRNNSFEMSQAYERAIELSREDPKVLEALGNHVQARHPSQLYEGFLEGLVIFLILYLVRVRFPRLMNGIITGLFFIFYAVFRILVETVREPDAEKIGALTKGQFYSTFMIVIGALFIVWGVVRKERLKQ